MGLMRHLSDSNFKRNFQIFPSPVKQKIRRFQLAGEYFNLKRADTNASRDTILGELVKRIHFGVKCDFPVVKLIDLVRSSW
jgi:hypothetical protein